MFDDFQTGAEKERFNGTKKRNSLSNRTIKVRIFKQFSYYVLFACLSKTGVRLPTAEHRAHSPRLRLFDRAFRADAILLVGLDLVQY